MYEKLTKDKIVSTKEPFKNEGISKSKTDLAFSEKAKSFPVKQIEIPDALCHSNETAAYYVFYLLLKAEAPGCGCIKDYTKQVSQLSKNFGISSSLFLFYLKQLEKIKIALLESNKIRLVGWNQLSLVLNINTKKRKKIPFLYGRDNLLEWISKNLNTES